MYGKVEQVKASKFYVRKPENLTPRLNIVKNNKPICVDSKVVETVTTSQQKKNPTVRKIKGSKKIYQGIDSVNIQVAELKSPKKDQHLQSYLQPTVNKLHQRTVFAEVHKEPRYAKKLKNVQGLPEVD